MDSQAVRKAMKTKILYTNGTGEFVETEWNKPPVKDNEIEVKAVMTGVCRSDIAMMMGEFGPLPIEMSGHEGLGVVTSIGSKVSNVNIGDYVATRGEPAYADYYNVRENEFVVVPEAHPKYILEPVACAINCVEQAHNEIQKRTPGSFLIIGSGFLAWVVYNYLKTQYYLTDDDIDVVGHSNKDLFGSILKDAPDGTYDVVIDLGSGSEVFDKPILNNQALVVFGVEKTITTNFQQLLWKACTMIFPSPRADTFYRCMVIAAELIEKGYIKVDSFWTKSYNRDVNWKEAFDDGVNRPKNYSRGYIIW